MKMSELKGGDWVVIDSGFTCAPASVVTVEEDEHGSLYFECSEGKHFLDGQLDRDGELVGLSRPSPAVSRVMNNTWAVVSDTDHTYLSIKREPSRKLAVIDSKTGDLSEYAGKEYLEDGQLVVSVLIIE